MNRREIVQLLKILCDNYTKKEIADPEGTVKAWELNLGPYEAEDIYKAARLHMSRSSYFPNPADLIKLISRSRIIYATPKAPQKAIAAPVNNTENKNCDNCALADLCPQNRCIYNI